MNDQAEVIGETNNNPVQSKSTLDSTVDFLLNRVADVLETIVKIVKGFFRFFLALTFTGKLVFIVILILFSVFFYLFGYSRGNSNGKESIREEVIEETGYEVDELGELSDELNNLKEQLDRLR
jgi:hypothetical protein